MDHYFIDDNGGRPYLSPTLGSCFSERRNSSSSAKSHESPPVKRENMLEPPYYNPSGGAPYPQSYRDMYFPGFDAVRNGVCTPAFNRIILVYDNGDWIKYNFVNIGFTSIISS